MSVLTEWSTEVVVQKEPTPKTNPNPAPRYDKSIPEIAEVMGLSEKTVKRIYSDAVRKIKQQYPNLKDEWL